MHSITGLGYPSAARFGAVKSVRQSGDTNGTRKPSEKAATTALTPEKAPPQKLGVQDSNKLVIRFIDSWIDALKADLKARRTGKELLRFLPMHPGPKRPDKTCYTTYVIRNGKMNRVEIDTAPNKIPGRKPYLLRFAFQAVDARKIKEVKELGYLDDDVSANGKPAKYDRAVFNSAQFVDLNGDDGFIFAPYKPNSDRLAIEELANAFLAHPMTTSRPPQ